jgi:hypothetical protein
MLLLLLLFCYFLVLVFVVCCVLFVCFCCWPSNENITRDTTNFMFYVCIDNFFLVY